MNDWLPVQYDPPDLPDEAHVLAYRASDGYMAVTTAYEVLARSTTFPKLNWTHWQHLPGPPRR